MTTFNAETEGSEVVDAFSARVKGRVFVITGASENSLGAQTALDLAAAAPAQLVLLARTESKIMPVIAKIKEISPATKTHFVRIDLASLASVRQAAADVATLVPSIDVMINAAGVMALQEYATSADGVEMQFAANHLGHFLLVNLLMPEIEAAAPGSRIVNYSSAGHCFDVIHFDDVNFDNGRDYNEWASYGQSKTANVAFSVGLAKKLQKQGILAFSLHPGNIYETGLASHIVDFDFDEMVRRFKEAGRPMPERTTLTRGVSSGLIAALDPSLKEYSGAYIEDCQVSHATSFAEDADTAEKLWILSEKLVGQTFDD